MASVQPSVSESAKGHRFGTHRLVPPEETLRRIAPLARSMGITRVANITGLDVIGVPVVAVVRPNSRSIAVAQGKGVDLVSAKVSGLMESIENFHAERIGLPLVLASWADMKARGATVDLGRLPRISGSILDPRAKLLWIEGHEVISRKPVAIPFEVVHADYTLPLPTGTGALLMSDSGVASGNHPLEAVSHAICELVERDAVTLWRFLDESRRHACRIELDGVEDPPCRQVLESLHRASIRVAVWDATSDVGIATFFCCILDESPSPWRRLPPASGSGCHPCRDVALLRALTEAAQARLTVIAGSRDDIGVAVYRRGQDEEAIQATLALMSGPARREFDEVPTMTAGTFREDVAWELARLQTVGIDQVAIVDLSRPDLGIPVVRVVIPGLEGIYEATGFSPGPRLRERLS